MQYIQNSSKSVQEIIQSIEEVAPSHKFGVLNVRDMKATLISKGFGIDEECVIMDICNPAVAQSFLNTDPLLVSVLPCKVSIYSEKGKTFVIMNSLTQLVDDINPDALELAQETQTTLHTIIDEAV